MFATEDEHSNARDASWTRPTTVDVAENVFSSRRLFVRVFARRLLTFAAIVVLPYTPGVKSGLCLAKLNRKANLLALVRDHCVQEI